MPLLIALQFLTRLPVSLSRIPTDEENGRSLLWYPLAGLLIGILLLLGWSLLQGVSPVLQAALLPTAPTPGSAGMATLNVRWPS